jgi:hypothetical protein
LGVEEAEVVAASVPIATGDAPVSDKRVAGVVELPWGVGELGRHRQQRLDLAVVLAVEVPPAGPVRNKVQHALGVPLGLHDRLVRAADDVAGWAEPPIRAKVGDPQVGAIPGHAWAVPGQPGKAAAIRAGTGSGVKIMAAGHHPRLGRPIDGKGHELVDHVRTLMAFSYTHQQLARRQESQVGVAQAHWRRGRRSDRHRIALPIDAVHALVVLITGEQRPARWKVGPAAILMDP